MLKLYYYVLYSRDMRRLLNCQLPAVVMLKLYYSVLYSRDMRRLLNCQFIANVMLKLYYSVLYSHLTYALLAWECWSCTILSCIPIWLIRYWHGNAEVVLFCLVFPSDLCVTGMGMIETHYNAAKIECAHRRASKLLTIYIYITKSYSIFTQFMIPLLYWRFLISILLIDTNISKAIIIFSSTIRCAKLIADTE